MSNAVILAPDSEHPSLSRKGFNLSEFMGKWYVLHSTLPLWKNKKDVAITYSPKEPSQWLQFDDTVEYRSESAASSSKPWTIRGVDVLVGPTDPGRFVPGASFQWRGKGLLVFSSSSWQVLGYGDGWAVTFFSKTLFTPAGIDIYSRDKDLTRDLYDEIMLGLSKHEETRKLAEGMFEIKHGD
ncbi:uncharacterized protein EI90DRAFT_3171838 [Cantharellus anzutake]|uniref:uncharacterized protein n=1 Tax=Cantharellus anzutake TaxID=1750568 RepID=UPI001908F6F0|nr:uncharacterized protein EI90DRAFT_3171838 [Cantharellus anzutake]KAF8335699.1 hypothetical protein EI90DRAFT_3171838 [Cantharellus anzutake]